MQYELKCANCKVGLYSITITKEGGKITEILVTCIKCKAIANMAVTSIDSIIDYSEV